MLRCVWLWLLCKGKSWRHVLSYVALVLFSMSMALECVASKILLTRHMFTLLGFHTSTWPKESMNKWISHRPQQFQDRTWIYEIKHDGLTTPLRRRSNPYFKLFVWRMSKSWGLAIWFFFSYYLTNKKILNFAHCWLKKITNAYWVKNMKNTILHIGKKRKEKINKTIEVFAL